MEYLFVSELRLFFVMPFVRGGELYRFFKARRRFKEKEVTFYAVQIALALGYLHRKGIVHRDLKLENILVDMDGYLKIIDFGLAKCYKSSDGEHIPFRDGKNLTGTARYASVNTHLGYEQSRRDDLETIGHVILYFLRGSLPWQGLPGRAKAEKYANIKKKKKETSIEDLCRDQPEEFKEFMHYCRGLSFT